MIVELLGENRYRVTIHKYKDLPIDNKHLWPVTLFVDHEADHSVGQNNYVVNNAVYTNGESFNIPFGNDVWEEVEEWLFDAMPTCSIVDIRPHREPDHDFMEMIYNAFDSH